MNNTSGSWQESDRPASSDVLLVLVLALSCPALKAMKPKLAPDVSFVPTQ
ncbi:MAG: hypothetical protein RM338_17690 [Nostoc sp. DedQUE12a]|nr:hypothetical protein [Nostoc sp. DedQUE12a]